MTQVLFFYFSSVIVVAAILVIALRKPVYSAMSLLVMFFHVAGLFVTLNAEFIAAIQIIVYAGAILVLYLFVVMLLNVREDDSYHKQIVVGLLFAGAFVIEAVFIMVRSGWTGASAPSPESAVSASAPGNTEAIGLILYTTYLFPFEVASLILLVAMVGAILFSKKGIFDG